MSNKQQRMQNANNYHRLRKRVGKMHQCPNCLVWHRDEGHFVPPSFGDRGFFACAKAVKP